MAAGRRQSWLLLSTDRQCLSPIPVSPRLLPVMKLTPSDHLGMAWTWHASLTGLAAGGRRD